MKMARDKSDSPGFCGTEQDTFGQTQSGLVMELSQLPELEVRQGANSYVVFYHVISWFCGDLASPMCITLPVHLILKSPSSLKMCYLNLSPHVI